MNGGSVSAKWFELSLRSDTPPGAEQHWRAEFRRKLCCPKCGWRHRTFSGEPVDVVLASEPPNVPMFSVYGPCGIARVDFLSLFSDATSGYLTFGKVLGPGGVVYSGLVSFTAAVILEPRGGPASGRPQCEECGRPRYFAEPFAPGQRYLTSDCLAPGRGLYLNSMCRLIVRRDLLLRIPLKTLKRLRIEELPVREHAEDGIKDFPAFWI